MTPGGKMKAKNPKSPGKQLLADREILDYTWRAGRVGLIIVKFSDTYYQGYIGIGNGIDIDADLIKIALYGDKLTYEEAHAFFPTLVHQFGIFKTLYGKKANSRNNENKRANSLS